jgi:hypothetical protein
VSADLPSHTHTASQVTDFSTAADARIAASSVNALSDVTISTPAAGQVLRYSGTAWVNATLSFNDLSNTPALVSQHRFGTIAVVATAGSEPLTVLGETYTGENTTLELVLYFSATGPLTGSIGIQLSSVPTVTSGSMSVENAVGDATSVDISTDDTVLFPVTTASRGCIRLVISMTGANGSVGFSVQNNNTVGTPNLVILPDSFIRRIDA